MPISHTAHIMRDKSFVDGSKAEMHMVWGYPIVVHISQGFLESWNQ